MKLALKIDVDTLKGTREGVPPLIDMLRKHAAQASFFFSLGPDHTGRALKRVFRPGFFGKVSRTSVVEHYGVKTLLYGTLLPGPDIGRRCALVMRGVRDAGFEVGIHTWDHVTWQDGINNADAEWTDKQMALAYERFADIFSEPAKTHAAAGWQTNVHALRQTQRHGFDYCSDTRGSGPFFPVVNAEIIDCPQLPTTLPTLDELIGVDGLTPDNVHHHLLELTEPAPPTGHVFTLHAELEGGKLAPVFERLLEGWKAQGYELASMAKMYSQLDRKKLPFHEVVLAEVPGRSGKLAMQGKPYCL
ncbi:MAG: 4-deoxy-4-formamido-L-arabinose-phosphoundecaprenol deformylase [Burkholderiales bacterium]|nr:4-deoxy-4-formamido-L-arabinose-phosphoundecaprenol deformylase [Burkholderiales bacterium]